MKKIILILFMLSSFTSLIAMQRLTSLSQLEENSYTFLVLERNGCPWCSKYKGELDFIVDDYEDQIKFYKLKKGSDVFNAFTKKYNKKIIIYPMTYILKSSKKDRAKIVYEMYGYKPLEYIEEDVFKEVFHKSLKSQ